MSNDLISRHEVVDTLEGVDWYHINDKGEMVQGSSSEHESWYRHDDIFKAIEAMPSAEPVQGEYCPYCGAKMGGNPMWSVEEVAKAFDLAIEALEREIKYGQMVVDLTKGEKVDDWVYDEDESATTTDLISRQAAIEAVCTEDCGITVERCEELTIGRHCKAYNALSALPSADTADVVRCKDCRYRELDGDVTHYYWCRINERPVDDTDYCAWGVESEVEG